MIVSTVQAIAQTAHGISDRVAKHLETNLILRFFAGKGSGETDKEAREQGRQDRMGSAVFAPKLTAREKMIAYLENHGPTHPNIIIEQALVTDANLRQVLSRDKDRDKKDFVVTMDGYSIAKIALQQKAGELCQ